SLLIRRSSDLPHGHPQGDTAVVRPVSCESRQAPGVSRRKCSGPEAGEKAASLHMKPSCLRGAPHRSAVLQVWYNGIPSDAMARTGRAYVLVSTLRGHVARNYDDLPR